MKASIAVAAIVIAIFPATDALAWRESATPSFDVAALRYDIVAKADSDTGQDRHLLRLQTLLRDRFKVAYHIEHKEIPVYELDIASSGPKLNPPMPNGVRGAVSIDGKTPFKAMSMARLAKFLERQPECADRPVVDKTNIEGEYSFTLNWTKERRNAASNRSPEDREPGKNIRDCSTILVNK